MTSSSTSLERASRLVRAVLVSCVLAMCACGVPGDSDGTSDGGPGTESVATTSRAQVDEQHCATQIYRCNYDNKCDPSVHVPDGNGNCARISEYSLVRSFAPPNDLTCFDCWGCSGHCGGQSPKGCFCDSACTVLGDCCIDKTFSCGGGI
jgi:hypothetical protein